jgi:hypothetical protein
VRGRTVHLDVAWIAPPDLEAVDALARLQLAAIRHGTCLRLRGVSPDLLDLLRLVGLAAAFGLHGGRPATRAPVVPAAGRRDRATARPQARRMRP